MFQSNIASYTWFQEQVLAKVPRVSRYFTRSGSSSLDDTGNPQEHPESSQGLGPAVEVPVIIHIDGNTKEITATQSTVGAALAEAQIGIGPLDQVEPPLHAEIVAGLAIRVARIERDIQVADVQVPYQTLWIGDDALALDHQELRVSGSNGNKRTRILLALEEGRETRKLHSLTWNTQEPVHRQIAFGRRLSKAVLETPDGGTITYWRKVRMFATSYSASRAGTPRDAPWYGFTYTSHRMGNGIVAMHKWVPLCTQVFVPGYGLGQVLDRGGGLGVDDIDLGYSDEDWRTWSTWVDVYLLWPPPADPNRIAWILPKPGTVWTGYNDNADCVSGRLGSRTDPCLCPPATRDE